MEWMTAVEASNELGVKPETLYAYVSRGILLSEREPGRRQSRFRRTEVERLAARRRRRAAGGEIVIDSSITLLDPAGILAYRGRPVDELARTSTFERTAEWLWTGSEGGSDPWIASPAALAAGRTAQDALAASSLADRLRVTTAAVATTDPLRHDRRPAAVTATAKQLIAALVDCLPPRGPVGRASAPIARRLWARLSARESSAERVAALDRALILLADHEMAASTFAARVTASTWADPYLVVLSGLSALGGPLHGGASRLARALLREALATSPQEAVGRYLRHESRIPGTGHAVYIGQDPRAEAMLEGIRAARPPMHLLRTAAAVVDLAGAHDGPRPNVDFALAVFEEAFDMPDGAGEAIFGIARTAGLIAHAIEEYQHQLRFRPRASYTGAPILKAPAPPSDVAGPPDSTRSRSGR